MVVMMVLPDLIALPASGMAWDHKLGTGTVEVPLSSRTAGLALSLVGDHAPLQSLSKGVTDYK